jgi:ABC-type lipoprotein export system ATPase subunit
MILQLKNISKSYTIPGSSGKRTILDNISLELESGAMAAIVGPSGSGKTTLLNIAGTLDKPDDGEVIIDGHQLSGLDEKSLNGLRSRTIGFVFQQHHLLPQLTLMENVLLPLLPRRSKDARKQAVQRAENLINKVGLSGKATQKPGQLSVGECQRTALVRALINEPEILLADEPTGALDKKSARQLTDLLLEINMENHITIVVVTHSMELANAMKLNYSLDEGKLKMLNRS